MMDRRLRIHLLAQAPHFPPGALRSIRKFVSSGQAIPTEPVSQDSQLALEARYLTQAFHGLLVSISREVC